MTPEDDRNAMQSACWEYQCPCHEELKLAKELLRTQGEAMERLKAKRSADLSHVIRAAVAEEREAWLKACGRAALPCACIGCVHPAHCACICPECNIAYIIQREREACARVADGVAMQSGGADVAAAAIRARGET